MIDTHFFLHDVRMYTGPWQSKSSFKFYKSHMKIWNCAKPQLVSLGIHVYSYSVKMLELETMTTRGHHYYDASSADLSSFICFIRYAFSSLNCSSSDRSVWNLVKKSTSFSLFRNRMSRMGLGLFGFATKTCQVQKNLCKILK
jgi:hypothetical protein